MAEVAGTDFVSDAFAQLVFDFSGDTAITNRVGAVFHHLADDRAGTLFDSAFGHDDNGERLAHFIAFVYFFDHLINGVGYFGNQNNIRRTGNARMQRNPSRRTAHNLHDHDAVMAFGSRMQAAQVLDDYIDGGIETEGDIGGF
jgi:hypothetical protein